MSYTVAQRDLIQDPNVIVELDRIAAVTKRFQASIVALGGGQTTRDAEAGLDTGDLVNTRPIADDGQLDTTSLLGGQWRAVAGSPWTYVSDTANVDFIDLSSYNELAILLRNVTGSAANIRQLLVSTDNGSSFLNASGDYVAIDSSGIETNDTVLSFHNTSSALARTMWGILRMVNLATPKLWAAGFATTNLVAIVPTTAVIDAIRVRPHTGSFTGGSIYVYGR